MAETAFQYAPEVVALATKAKVHPHDVEPCEWCGLLQPIRHRDCAKRPFLLVGGAFSPSGSRKTKSAGGAWTWRRVSSGACRVGLVTPMEKLHRRRRTLGAQLRETSGSPSDERIAAQREFAEVGEAIDAAQSHWVAKSIWVIASWDNVPEIIVNVSGEERGREPHFDICVWEPFEFGHAPKMIAADHIEFACELHPMFSPPVAEQLRDAAAGRGE